MTEVAEKACTKCGVVRPLSEYHKCAAVKSGLASQCKECSRAAAKESSRRIREADRDEYNRRRRDYARQRLAADPVGERNRRRAHNRKWRAANTDRIKIAERAAERARWAEGRQLLLELKAKPCADCGIQYPAPVMEFDHVRGKKNYAISAGAMRRGDLLDELAKCELRCANCHRLRHHYDRTANGT